MVYAIVFIAGMICWELVENVVLRYNATIRRMALSVLWAFEANSDEAKEN